MSDEVKEKKFTPAYVPFRTFMTALDSLQHGVPHIIDRTVWPTFSGLYQSQTLGAFRFLGLIDAEGRPTADLQKLVEEKDSRAANLRKILERSYSSLIQKDLVKMTPASFNSAMEQYGATGDTHRKAVSFFLKAAKYSGLPISPYIKRIRTARSPKKRRPSSSTARGQYVGDMNGIADNGTPSSSGPTKTVELGNGIVLSLAVSADMFQMDSTDRQFVLGLLEQIEKYETEHKSSENQEGNA